MRLHLTALLLSTSLFLLVSSSCAEDLNATKSYETVEQRRIEDTILQERANIRKEREEISLRKKELKTLEESVDKKLADIDSKLQELSDLQKRIELLLEKKSAEEKKRLKNLAVIYERMSPGKAALALSGLEEQLAADLLAAMKVKAAAKILDQTTKQKTAELSTTFSTLQLE
jgi:flagellar motility protein MotE (MotC chaperone)